LIEPLPAGHPARIEGERKIAELEDGRAQRRPAWHDGHRPQLMKWVAEGVWRSRSFRALEQRDLAEDVLIDAGRRLGPAGRISPSWRAARSRCSPDSRSPDHQGVAKDVCEARGIPLACHADEVEAMEGRRPMQEAAPGNPYNRVIKASGRDRPIRSTGC